MSGVPSAPFRERALYHYTTLFRGQRRFVTSVSVNDRLMRPDSTQDDRAAERCRFKLITPAAVRRRGGVFAKLYSILISERLPRLTVTCEAVRGKFSRAVVRILAYQTARHIVGTTYQYPG